MALGLVRSSHRHGPVGDQELLRRGREVVDLEAAALAQLGASLDDTFVQAVSLLLEATGRIVVTGMGKSGHIARKVAATLASTRSPAIFVHPAEASHGDLGMLVPGDVLLAFTNSGGTPELRSIVAHAQALAVPVIGITSRRDAPVLRHADVTLVLPPAREACPANIAPTTSTVLMLALGDALAMATMHARGTSREGLQALHPGGSIGQRLTRVSAIMHLGETLPLVQQAMPMREVIVRMTSMSFGVAGVVDADGRLVGVITDGDLRRHIDELMDATAVEVMTRDPVTVTADTFAEDCVALMEQCRITSLFVTDVAAPGRPVGLVHVHDFLRLGTV
ncbi:KpsF/GutQ family sugar-phosphate isomerase [Sphingomonas solaris]|uniref:KpsF/GutQ family sugar-phosphate isomerase n=1 Tax=Alterirhizorhabdus solaris TaxID=2529389 RepID=A0A558R3T5_9SPHN|nr:KpsF/GutQ family sugar-phosphate isomerase [Sphingomonas solaris]TVV74046.1 KpsF/GutQ family sugar-phosphate isomerase [Sphingomonas solaris]